MSSSLVEVARSLHQEVESHIQRIVDDLSNEYKLNKKRIQRDHRVKQRLELIHSNMSRLLDIYKDTDGLVALELKEISGAGRNVYEQFMEKVEELCQSYSRDPNVVSYTFENPHEKLEDSIDRFDISTVFSPPERNGKLFDLSHFYQRFINLNIFKTFKHQYEIAQFDYYAYLSNFDDMITIIPYRIKATANHTIITQYISYLVNLIAYLKAYFNKLHPLVPLSELEQEISSSFQEIWDNNAVAGYFPNATSVYRDDKPYGLALSMSHKDIDVYFAKENSPKTLHACTASHSHTTTDTHTPTSSTTTGASVVAANPLYCIPCGKLFTKQSLYDSHLPGKKHMKAAAQLQRANAAAGNNGGAGNSGESGGEGSGKSDGNGSGSGENAGKSEDTQQIPDSRNGKNTGGKSSPENIPNSRDLYSLLQSLCIYEFSLTCWADLCRDTITHTRTFTDKLLTKSYEEIIAEEGEEEEEEEPEEDTMTHGQIYNPKNVPLGWDGKPIPLWMYKLHGLNLMYTCEICGNDVHRGERNYIKHFREWKHTHMLKCLGITNSSHFINVPTIHEAQALNERLMREAQSRQFRDDVEEEMEDALGNIYSKEEYEAHKRQGLIF